MGITKLGVATYQDHKMDAREGVKPTGDGQGEAQTEAADEISPIAEYIAVVQEDGEDIDDPSEMEVQQEVKPAATLVNASLSSSKADLPAPFVPQHYSILHLCSFFQQPPSLLFTLEILVIPIVKQHF